jgi:hypothetical protein
MDGSVGTTDGRRDRWLVWPALIFLLLVLFFAAMMGDPYLFEFLVIWFIAAVLALGAAGHAASSMQPRRTVSFFILPVASALMLLAPVTRSVVEVGERLHFWVAKPGYLKEIADIPKGAGPRLALFDRGDDFTGFHVIIYDEADQLLLPEEQRSDAWKNRVYGGDPKCIAGGYSVGDHFYIGEIGC